MPEACCEYIYSARAELSPVCLILTLVTFGSIVVSLPLLGSRFLFGIRKPVKCFPKLCLFITWSNIALPDILGANTKSAGCS